MKNNLFPPLLLTCAIQPAAHFTAMQEVDARLSYTIESLSHWISIGFTNIVICDGSGFDIEQEILARISISKDVKLELLSFENNVEMVKVKGKGYGEGEITKYAIDHSELLISSKTFAKCTSKLWVENFEDVYSGFRGEFLADVHGFLSPTMIDTRFYLCRSKFYKDCLRECYKDVDDSSGYYLEHAFLAAVLKSKIRNWISTPSMRTKGMSGSSGMFQERSRSRAIIRDIRNLVLSQLY